MRAGVVAIRRSRFFSKHEARMFLVRGCVLEQPDVEDLVWIVWEKVELEPVDGPLNRALGMLAQGAFRFVADNHKRRLNKNSELRRRRARVRTRQLFLYFTLELTNVPGEFNLGESRRGHGCCTGRDRQSFRRTRR